MFKKRKKKEEVHNWGGNKIFILIIARSKRKLREMKCGAFKQINCQQCSLMPSVIS